MHQTSSDQLLDKDRAAEFATTQAHENKLTDQQQLAEHVRLMALWLACHFVPAK
jgi:hypothetical protein